MSEELSEDEEMVFRQEFIQRMVKRFEGYVGLPTIGVVKEALKAEAIDELEKIMKDISDGLYG